MSYINLRDDGSLPAINSARRIKALEQELQYYRQREIQRPRTPVGILKNDGNTKELHDQVNLFREELDKKDRLIQHLVSLDGAPKVPRAPDSYRVKFEPSLDSLYLGERSALDSTRTELAGIQVKFERAQVQLRELQNEMQAKDIKVNELQLLLDASRDQESRLTEMVASLREKLGEFESKAGSFETVANRGEFTISTLQRDNRLLNDKIIELEQRLSKQLEDREASESKLLFEGKRLREILSQISTLLRTEDLIDDSPETAEIVIKNLNELIQENAMLKGKMVSMNEHLNKTNLETKASRETIMRLVSEVGREQRVATQYTTDMENLRLERDTAVGSRMELEREIGLLKERLQASNHALEATKAELDMREQRSSTIERELRATSTHVRTTSTQFDLFREQLANILSATFDNMTPTEQCLKDTVQRLAQDKKASDLRVEELENRVRQMTDQLEQELGLHQDLKQRAKRFEVETADMAERLRAAEGELAAGECLRDGFKFDKEKYLRGLQKLGEVMKMDRISLDLGLDLTMDALVARAQQLVKLEMDALADKSTHVYNLQRKVKALKEQLESKDLHIDLLRKKMTSLEERLHGRVDSERVRETDSLRIQKLERLASKYKLQLQDSRQEVQNLKAQLLGSTELQARTLEQRKDIEELARQIEELEEVRKRQSHKISKLKNEVETTETSMQETNMAQENAVQALSSELRTTKNALDAIKYREKQLVDFRTVVARMLGLDIETLAVPDYEVISRLEKLIQAHHTTAFTTLSLEEALQDAQDGAGPLSANFRRTIEAADPVVHRSRERNRRRAARFRGGTMRARSVSPMRRDPRVY
ncbi:hypothetical protein RRG08_054331 [Elysia crispata]|uniref:Coiled-coil domain-containing protein 170 n=1 Tax=Elysia crispata TaxID=231223 RepID=A0AAE1B480_9GAST|nr:hypothetical protein RRG08_054331 [Elysia crispata]